MSRPLFQKLTWIVHAANMIDVVDSLNHLVRDTVPAVVEGGGLVLRPQRYHHQVVAGTGHVEQDDQSANSWRLAHRRALLGTAERRGVKKELHPHSKEWCCLVYSRGETRIQQTWSTGNAQKYSDYPASTYKWHHERLMMPLSNTRSIRVTFCRTLMNWLNSKHKL